MPSPDGVPSLGAGQLGSSGIRLGDVRVADTIDGDVSENDGSPPQMEALFRAPPGAGRDRAWRAFLSVHGPLIRHVLKSFEDEAKGLQARFVAVVERLTQDDFQRLREYSPSSYSFPTWLCVTVHRAARESESRGTRIRPTLEDLLAKRFGAPDVGAVRTALRGLPARDRLLLRLRFEQRMPPRRIAGLMGYASASHVRNRCKELCAALRVSRVALSSRSRGSLPINLARDRVS